METSQATILTIGCRVQAPIEKVWAAWTEPAHIIRWNHASDDWHCPRAENDLRAGGKFLFRMEERDGSNGFDFSGKYTEVKPFEKIAYILDDGRRVEVLFTAQEEETSITFSFGAEKSLSIQLQQQGWQAILDNFSDYAGTLSRIKTLHFEILIGATADHVYNVMLDEDHYREWTKEFSPSSHYRGSWQKGSRMLFLNGNGQGMVSLVQENLPGRLVSLRHLGIVQDGKEITSGPEAKGWAGTMENYSFSGADGSTILTVAMDSNLEYIEYFRKTWPRALERLRQLCER